VERDEQQEYGAGRQFTTELVVVDEGKTVEFDVHMPKDAGRK
jgi:hypothetical protein